MEESKEEKLLKEVVFCLYYDNDDIRGNIEKSIEVIQNSGVSAKAVFLNDKEMPKECFPASLGVYNSDDVLFLTDSAMIASALLEQRAFVIGIMHDYNQGADFTGLKYVFSDIEDVEFDSYEKAYQRYAHLPWIIMETERCIIRETTVEDVDIFYDLYKDPEMTRYMEGLFDDPEDEKQYTRDYIDKVYGLLGFGTWTILKKDTGEIIGRAGFSIRNGFDDIELGFLIGTKYQRQGYAYEVCSAIIQYGKEVLLFKSLQALVKKENVISIHLCEKLGFKTATEVDVEENIYGDNYGNGIKVPASKAQYGRYLKMLLDLG